MKKERKGSLVSDASGRREGRMNTAKLFKSGTGQAARLPEGFGPWDALVDSLGQFTSDFMEDRGQPTE